MLKVVMVVVVVVVVECVCWWMDVPLTTGGDREPGDMDQSLPHSPPVSLPATTSTRTLTAPHCPHHILLHATTHNHQQQQHPAILVSLSLCPSHYGITWLKT